MNKHLKNFGFHIKRRIHYGENILPGWQNRRTVKNQILIRKNSKISFLTFVYCYPLHWMLLEKYLWFVEVSGCKRAGPHITARSERFRIPSVIRVLSIPKHSSINSTNLTADITSFKHPANPAWQRKKGMTMEPEHLSILVIDSVLSSRDSVVGLLQDCGYKVRLDLVRRP